MLSINDSALRITTYGFIANAGMSALKLVGGRLCNSHILTADAYHSLEDLGGDAVALIGIGLARHKQSGLRVEKALGIAIGACLLAGAMRMMCESGSRWWMQSVGPSGTSVKVDAEYHQGVGESTLAIGIAVLSVFVKEKLYRNTMEVARRTDSAVLASTALHHRLDSLTSVVALLALAVRAWDNTLSWIDHISTFVIAAVVLKAALTNVVHEIGGLVIAK